ncbi:hypothetical protein UPYG_G00314090 [Umbra pygmaea]|uniref:Kelch-like protein 23 n=1 Tax=Umbra pygmaea TaxID=75934 RepID=A0ABD0WML4_UMBPY
MHMLERLAMSEKIKESYIHDFCDIAHPNELLDALREFYIGGTFTDITIQCATGQIFHCHKAALSARSSYFKALFTADMQERTNNLIKLTGIGCEVLSSLLNYIYTSRVSITKTNVQSLLEAADLLQFISVKQACQEFLIRFLDVDNCLGMHSFAELHVCPELEREAQRVMLSRFEDLMQQEEFLEVDYNKLNSIMSSKNLNVWKDEVLLDAVIKWVTGDFVNRVNHIQDLLRCIHLELDEMYFNTALDVQGKCLLGNERKLRSLIIHTLKSTSRETSARRRKSPSMYLIGGYYWHPLCEVHIWDPDRNTWMQGKNMPDQTLESYSVSVLGADIYVTGGYESQTIDALDTVWIYNGDCDEWAEGRSMITARYYHCSVTLLGCVYAIGGYRRGAIQHETEFYDPLQKKWFPTANMIQGVGNATACVMNDTIYVTGGHYGTRGKSTYENIQVYRPDINEWNIVTITPHPEYGLCSVSLNNKLYLVGGQTTITDCYDPDRDEWRQLSVMKERRMECGYRSKSQHISHNISQFIMAENQEMSELETKVARQIEYYFGDHNLPRDKFLKEQLALDDGWVPLETMLKFNRLKCLTTDENVIVESLKKSKTGLLEVSEDKTKVRRIPSKALPELNEEYKDALKHKSVYIKGFPLDTTLDEIEGWLNGKGVIENIQMRRNLEKNFKGSVFLVFDTEEAAKQFLDRPDTKTYKENEMIVLSREEYHAKKAETRKQFKTEIKAKAKQDKDEKLKQAEDEEQKYLNEQVGCLLKFSGNLHDVSREDFHEVFSGHGEIKWIDFTRGAKEGTILFRVNAKEALDKAKEANGGNLKIKDEDVTWEVVEGDAERELLKKIIECQQESFNKRRGSRGGRGGRGRGGGRGGRRDRGGRDGKSHYQGKKTKFDDSGDEDEAPPSPKKRALDEVEKDADAPAAKVVKT